MARLILVLIITTTSHLLTPCSGSQHSDLPRKRLADTRSTQPLIDPCQKERSMKMICHCTPDHRAAHSVRAAECWILKNDLTAQDPLWRAFDRYTSIADLKFIVQSGSLNFLPTTVFGKLTNLKEVAISFSHINIVESFAFANSSSLHAIRLNHNNLTRIHKFAFANHYNLERIDLEENDLSQIDSHAFSNLTRLEYLALNSNKISELPKGAFRELNSLLELQLQHNNISAISSEWFLRLENLRILKLSSNKLKAIWNAVFSELWSLEELYLDKNKIETISERAFDGLNNLRRLSLQQNRLKRLEKTVFTSLPVIKWLNLSENQLKSLDHGTFSDIFDNFLQADSSLSLNENVLVCDCTLNWLIDLRNRTKSAVTQQTIDRVKCLLTDVNNVPEEVLLNASVDEYPAEDTDTNQVLSVDFQSGSMVNLFLLDQIPCPTSLPLPRESTGFRDGSGGSSRTTSAIVTAIILLAFVMCIHNNLE